MLFILGIGQCPIHDELPIAATENAIYFSYILYLVKVNVLKL